MDAVRIRLRWPVARTQHRVTCCCGRLAAQVAAVRKVASAVTCPRLRIRRCAAACSPRWSSSFTQLQKVPTGLGEALAHDVEGRAVDGLEHAGVAALGSMLPVGAMPRLPASAAARSLRMSACRLVATMVSSVAGRLTMRAVAASTSSLSHRHIGKLLADLQRDFIPHHHGVALGVAFRDHREQLARPRLGQLERQSA